MTDDLVSEIQMLSYEQIPTGHTVASVLMSMFWRIQTLEEEIRKLKEITNETQQN